MSASANDDFQAGIHDEELILEFVIESRDHLAGIEPDFLKLEQCLDDIPSELINRIFRAIHSIKGASGFFGLTALKNLSHVMESLLMMVRDGQMQVCPPMIDLLLQGVDCLRTMLEDVSQSESVPYEDLVSGLNAYISGENSGGNDRGIQGESNRIMVSENQSLVNWNVSSEEWTQWQNNGHHFFEIILQQQDTTPLKEVVLNQKLSEICKVGQIVASTPETLASQFAAYKKVKKTQGNISILFASVLERDLLVSGLGLEESAIQSHVFSPIQTETETTPEPSAELNPPESQSEHTQLLKEPAPRKVPTSSPVENSVNTETVRVKVDLLNRLMDLAGEMVLSRNQLLRVFEKDLADIDGLASIMQNVDLITTDLQEHIMQTRMQSISGVFGRFPRVVRDMSNLLGKQIQLDMSGEEVELDKSILEKLTDPLTHLIRNCCDHALETSAERLKMGKAPTGTISLKAFQESGQINIAIKDDGRGIDHEKIARKAIANAVISENELKRMSTQEIVQLIFMPGFSTAEQVSEISGRGVGMDVVRTNIEGLGGTISVETMVGKGTQILLRLPLTLAIIPSLIVGVAQHKFAIPQVNLVELVCIRAEEAANRIEKVGSVPVLRLRGNLLPLVKLSEVLKVKTEIFDFALPTETHSQAFSKDEHLLVLKSGAVQYGLIVDEIFDMEEIVVKPLSSVLKNCRCFSGATIMGDGKVAMILDTNGIIQNSGLSFHDVEQEKSKLIDSQSFENTKSLRQSIITFNVSEDEIFALPLESVLRLEKLSMDKVERLGNKEFISYRGNSLPLVRLEKQLPIKGLDPELEDAYLIIPKVGNGAAGIITSRILDTIETEIRLENAYMDHPGVQGVTIIQDRHTLLIEPEGFLKQAGIHVDLPDLASDLKELSPV
jgi:two-component system, chemotaxis family, sensor kinase CheA